MPFLSFSAVTADGRWCVARPTPAASRSATAAGSERRPCPSSSTSSTPTYRGRQAGTGRDSDGKKEDAQRSSAAARAGGCDSLLEPVATGCGGTTRSWRRAAAVVVVVEQASDHRAAGGADRRAEGAADAGGGDGQGLAEPRVPADPQGRRRATERGQEEVSERGRRRAAATSPQHRATCTPWSPHVYAPCPSCKTGLWPVGPGLLLICIARRPTSSCCR